MTSRLALLASAICLATAAPAGAQFWNINGDAGSVQTTGAVASPPFSAGEASSLPEAPLVAQAPVPAPPPDQPMPTVDESALRYFARQGDTRRLEIEIARLRALYPSWTPPADPLAVPLSVDERLEAVWLLYSQGRLAEARQAIAERQMSEPQWQPPSDLLDRLAVSEARERLVNASNLDQYQTVVRVGSENPSLLTCSEVDVLWRVAEAFAMTERQPRARDAYRYVLTTCDDPQERLATMQNAAQLLSADLRDELLTLERFGDDGAGEFAPVRDDLARDALAAAGEDASVTASAEDIARVERLAGEGPSASDARLLGWYYLGRDDAEAAERWFRMAFEAEAEGDAAEGLALALIERDAFAEAEDVAFPYRDENDDRRQVYLAAAANLLAVEPRVALAPDILARIVGEVVETRNAPAAQQLGWYARAYGQHETAGQWFSTALGFDPDDEASAYGLALTHLQLADTAGLAEVKRQWTGRSDRIATVGTPQAEPAAPTPPPPAPGGAQNVQPAQPLAYTAAPVQPAAPTIIVEAEPRAAAPARTRPSSGCSASTDPRGMAPRAALTLGWCLMEIDRPLEAARAFDVALRADGATARDAAYGQSLAYLRAGLVDEAAVAATAAPMNSERSAELQASILAERALGAFERRRYAEALMALDQRAQIAAERNDLMVLRGYAYLNLYRTEDARRVFQSVAGTGSREGLRGLAAVDDQMNSQR